MLPRVYYDNKERRESMTCPCAYAKHNVHPAKSTIHFAIAIYVRVVKVENRVLYDIG